MKTERNSLTARNSAAEIDALRPAGPRAAYLEEGAAMMALVARGQGMDADVQGTRQKPEPDAPERFDVIVIGAGHSGLSAGYHLKRRGVSFVILDAGERVGDVWRKRWDSLHLFSPARYDSLDGMPFPAPPQSFPSKDEMADYLEAYAAHFALPVRLGVRVNRVTKRDGRFVVEAGKQRFEAGQVVVAMSTYQKAWAPDFAADLDPGIVQLHSSDYRNPGQLRDGDVLLVGAGNSASEIARDLTPSRRVFLSGRHPGHIPFRIEGFFGRNLLVHILFGLVFHRVLTTRTPMGRRAQRKIKSATTPLIRVKPKDLDAAGVERLPRIAGVRDGLPVTDDGRVLDVANVVWCTGFDSGLSWIDLPIFGDDGWPIHQRGVAAEDGLYFVGLGFLYAFSSMMIQGVGRDAAYIADHIAERVARSTPA